MSNEPDWSDAMVKQLGHTVRELRGSRTVQWLSDATAAAGKRIAKASISEMENGNRKVVSITDLLILAAALHVPPMLLIYPGLPDKPVEALPGVHVTSWQALQWFSGGEVAGCTKVDPDINRGVFPLARERQKVRRALIHAETALLHRTEAGAGVLQKYADDSYELQGRLGLLEQQIRDLGGTIVDGGER